MLDRKQTRKDVSGMFVLQLVTLNMEGNGTRMPYYWLDQNFKKVLNATRQLVQWRIVVGYVFPRKPEHANREKIPFLSQEAQFAEQ